MTDSIMALESLFGIRYKGKEYILTAAHVIKPSQDHRKLKFLGRPSVPFKNVTFNQLPGIREKGISSFGLSEAASVMSQSASMASQARMLLLLRLKMSTTHSHKRSFIILSNTKAYSLLLVPGKRLWFSR